MARRFNLELVMREAPAEAQARAATALTDPTRTLGLRLATRGAGRLGYRPRVQFPFMLMLMHYINRERMTVLFESDGTGGTRVTIAGAVARSKHGLATDTEHWTEALGATPAT